MLLVVVVNSCSCITQSSGFQLMVRCPPDAQYGDRIVVSAPNPRNSETFTAAVPKGVNPGEQFVVVVRNKQFLVTCPPGVGEGMNVKVLVPKLQETVPKFPLGQAKFQVVIPAGVHPGEAFALIANNHKFILTCPQRAMPGEKIEFMVPISLPSDEIMAVKLVYEKRGWTRCLNTDLTFTWLHQEAAGQGSGGARLTREKMESRAFVRQITKELDSLLGLHVELVPASESKLSTIVDGQTMAMELAKHVNATFQTKEAWFRGEVSRLQIPWQEGHIRINVRRANLLVDAMEAFESVKREDLRKTFRFEFMGEPGIDAGGVSREFFQVSTSACVFSSNIFQ
jgi:hypothetical protein